MFHLYKSYINTHELCIQGTHTYLLYMSYISYVTKLLQNHTCILSYVHISVYMCTNYEHTVLFQHHLERWPVHRNVATRVANVRSSRQSAKKLQFLSG